MTEQAQPRPQTEGANAMGAFLAQKIREAGVAVSDEIEQLRADAAERAATGAQGAAASLPLMALRRVMPGWAVALLVAGGSGALAAALARRGLDDLHAAAPTKNGGPP